MIETMTRYRSVLDGFERVLLAVPADRWDSPSPCEGWRAVDVAGHVIGGLRLVGLLAIGRAAPGERASDHAQDCGDPAASWTAARAATEAALTPEALERLVPGPTGDLPLRLLLDRFMVGEVLVHTWDLARAAGLDVELDPVLVEETFAAWEPLDGPVMRQPGVFGPRLPAPDGASRAEQFVSFVGRAV